MAFIKGEVAVGRWMRALTYMCAFGVSWFVLLPAALLRVEGRAFPMLRSLRWTVLGGGLLLAGSAISLLAGYYLVTVGRGTPFPLDPTRMLVTSGPYSYIRNPQAVGTMLIVMGEVASVQSRSLMLMIPLTLVYLEGPATCYEDRELRLRFGMRYLEYRAHVRKWMPRRRRRECAMDDRLEQTRLAGVSTQ